MIKKLPVDVWSVIFQIVYYRSPQAIFTLAITNSLFNSLASRLIYSNLTLRIYDYHLFDDEFANDDSAIQSENDQLFIPSLNLIVSNEYDMKKDFHDSRVDILLKNVQPSAKARSKNLNWKTVSPWLNTKVLDLDVESELQLKYSLGEEWLKILLVNMSNLVSIDFGSLSFSEKYFTCLEKYATNLETIKINHTHSHGYLKSLDTGLERLFLACTKLENIEIDFQNSAISMDTFLFMFDKLRGLRRLVLTMDCNDFFQFIENCGQKMIQGLEKLEMVYISTFIEEFSTTTSIQEKTISLIKSLFPSTLEITQHEFQQTNQTIHLVDLYPKTNPVLTGTSRQSSSAGKSKSITKFDATNSLESPELAQIWKQKSQTGLSGILSYITAINEKNKDSLQKFDPRKYFRPVFRGTCVSSDGYSESINGSGDRVVDDVVAFDRVGREVRCLVFVGRLRDIQVPFVEDELSFDSLLTW